MIPDPEKLIDPLKLDGLLANNHTFSFKRQFKGWYLCCFCIFVIIGIVTAIFSVHIGLIGVLMITIPLVIVFLIFFYFVRFMMSHTLVISPESIVIRRKDNIMYKCLFEDIYNVEYFTKITTIDNVSSKENKLKIIKKNGRIREITADFWVTPPPLPSYIFIRNIISYYMKNK